MKIKINSNPYTGTIEFDIFDENSSEWKRIDEDQNPKSKLVALDVKKCFFPFNIEKILDIIKKEYGIENVKISLIFEGCDDEYIHLERMIKLEKYQKHFELVKSNRMLEEARDIFDEIQDIFDKEIRELIRDSETNLENMMKL